GRQRPDHDGRTARRRGGGTTSPAAPAAARTEPPRASLGVLDAVAARSVRPRALDAPRDRQAGAAAAPGSVAAAVVVAALRLLDRARGPAIDTHRAGGSGARGAT